MSATTTAIIVTYNSERCIGQALDSALLSHRQGNLDCIVVDSASVDGTTDVVRRDHPWATLLASPVNLGYGRGLNHGLAHVRTKYVLFMNPDAVLSPEALGTLVEFLETHPKAGIVAPALVEEEETLQAAGVLPTPVTVVGRALGVGAQRRAQRPIVPNGEPFQTDWLCGAVLLTRTDLMKEMGGFDPRFFLYFEETDLCRRVIERGYELWAVGKAVAGHIGGASAKKVERPMFDACIAEHYFQSRFYYLAKHYGWLAAAGAEIGEVLGLTAACLVRPARHRFQRLAARLRAPLFKVPPRWVPTA
jgi:N-acetylglucosaminyl-diphospho-decaprenol L-rhamnosyltransferase